MMWKVGSEQKCQAGTKGIADSRLLKGDFSPSWLSIRPAFGRGADLNFREQGAFGQLDGLKGDVHDAVLSKGGAVAAGAQPIVHGHPVMEDQPRDHWA